MYLEQIEKLLILVLVKQDFMRNRVLKIVFSVLKIVSIATILENVLPVCQDLSKMVLFVFVPPVISMIVEPANVIFINKISKIFQFIIQIKNIFMILECDTTVCGTCNTSATDCEITCDPSCFRCNT